MQRLLEFVNKKPRPTELDVPFRDKRVACNLPLYSTEKKKYMCLRSLWNLRVFGLPCGVHFFSLRGIIPHWTFTVLRRVQLLRCHSSKVDIFRLAIVFKSGHLLVVVTLKDFLKSEFQVGNLYVQAGAFPSGFLVVMRRRAKREKNDTPNWKSNVVLTYLLFLNVIFPRPV